MLEFWIALELTAIYVQNQKYREATIA